MKDDRNKDESLDTDLEMGRFEGMDLEDPFGGDISFGDPGGRQPTSPTKAIITEGISGLRSGAGDAVKEELERNMPNVSSIVTEAKDSYEDVKQLKDEISKQLAPMMQSLESTTRKLLPRVEKLMPKSWYEKAKKTLDERAAAREPGYEQQSKEAMENDQIKAELASIFEQQIEMNQHNEFERNKSELMDKALESTRHKDSIKHLMHLYDSTRSIEVFHRTLHTAYLKKSLELKYRQYFLAKDTYNLMARTVSTFEGYLKGIQKNTSLPDVMKEQMADYIKKSRTQKYGTMMSDFMTNARKMMFNKIKSALSDTLGGLGMAASMAEGAPDMIDMAEQMTPGGLKGIVANHVGSWLGKMGAASPIRAAFEKFAPIIGRDGEIENSLSNIKARTYLGMDKLRRKWMTDTGTFSPLKQMIASFMPGMDPISSGSNDLLSKSESAAVFDKLTRQSITEIIPGYLGKIWHSVEMIRDPNAKEKIFNVYNRRFTTVEELKDKVYNDPHLNIFGSTEAQGYALKDAVSALKTGFKRSGKKDLTSGQFKGISRVLTNISLGGMQLETDKIIKYVDDPSSMENDSYIKNITLGLGRQDADKALAAIAGGIRKADGTVDDRLLRKFDNALITIRTNSDQIKERGSIVLENFGLRHVLGGEGEDDLIRDNNAFNKEFIGKQVSRFNYDSNLRDSLRYQMQTDRESLDRSDITRAQLREKWSDIKNSGPMKFFKGLGEGIKDFFTEKDVLADAIANGAINGGIAAGINPSSGTASGDNTETPAPGVSPNPVTPVTPTSGSGVAAATGAVAPEGGKGKLSLKAGIRNAGKAMLTGLHTVTGAIPKSREDAKTKLDQLQTTLDEYRKKFPKDKASVIKAIDDMSDKLKEKYPEQHAKLLAMKDAVVNDQSFKDLVEVASWVSDEATNAYDKYAAEHVDEAKRIITENATKIAHGAKRVGKRTRGLAKLYRKDPEKAKAMLRLIWEHDKEAAANIAADIGVKAEELKSKVEQNETYNKGKSIVSDALSSARAKVTNAIDSIKTKIPGATEAAKAAIAPVTEAIKPKEKPTAEYDGEIIPILQEWRQEVSTAHNTIFEMISIIEQHLDNGLKVNGVGTVSGTGDGGPIKRKKFGVFGRGGEAIGTAVKKIGKLGWTATKKVGNFYASAYSGALKAAGTAASTITSGIGKFGGWLTNEIGMTPYVDIYVRGQEGKKPILTWRKQAFGDGVVYADADGKPTKERVKASKDIPKKGMQVCDPKTGNILISNDDLKAGLWTGQGPLYAAAKFATAGVRGIADIYAKGIGGVFSLAKIAAGALLGVGTPTGEKFVDIYVRGQDPKDGPKLTRLRQKKGVYMVGEGGKMERVKRSSDIHSPVYDKTGKECLIDKDDIEKGLVDVDGNKLGSLKNIKFGLAGGILGTAISGAFAIGKKLAPGIGKAVEKIGGGIGSMYKDVFSGLFGAALGGVKKVGNGLAMLGSRLFGFEEKSGGSVAKSFDKLFEYLSKLNDYVKIIADKVNGDAGLSENKDGVNETKANAKASRGPSAADNYKHTNHKKKPEEGAKSEGGDEGEEESSLLEDITDLWDDFGGRGKKGKRGRRRRRRGGRRRARGGRPGRSGGKLGKFQKFANSKWGRKLKLNKLGKLGKFGKLGGLTSKLGSIGGLFGAAKSGVSKAASSVTSKVAGSALGKAVGAAGIKGTTKVLGAAAAPIMAAWDAVDGYRNAAAITGKSEDELTTGDKLGAAGDSMLSGLTLGLVSAKTMHKATGLIRDPLENAINGHYQAKLDKMNADTAEFMKGIKAKTAKRDKVLLDCVAGRSVGKGNRATAAQKVLNKYIRDVLGIKGRNAKLPIKTECWWDDEEFVAKFKDWCQKTLPIESTDTKTGVQAAKESADKTSAGTSKPDASDAQARYDAFMKLYKNPDRTNAKYKEEAASYGVDVQGDADEWEDARRDLGNKVKAAKVKSAAGVTSPEGSGSVAASGTLVGGEVATASGSKRNSSRSAKDLEFINRLSAGTSKPDAELFTVQQKPKDLPTPQELTMQSDQVNQNRFDKVSAAISTTPKQATGTDTGDAKFEKMYAEMRQFMSVFGNAFAKDGLKVSGMNDLLVVTASKPAGGTTVVNNNTTVVQSGESGLDLRKKQF